MAKYQKRWARKKRQWLLNILGGKCNWCSTTTNLEFDCKTPQGHAHHKLDTERRMIFYVRQWKANNLQLLCTNCHIKKSHQEVRLQNYEATINANPF